MSRCPSCGPACSAPPCCCSPTPSAPIATAYALTGSSLNIVTILLYAQIRGDVLHDQNLGYALALGMILITGLSNAAYIVLRAAASAGCDEADRADTLRIPSSSSGFSVCGSRSGRPRPVASSLVLGCSSRPVPVASTSERHARPGYAAVGALLPGAAHRHLRVLAALRRGEYSFDAYRIVLTDPRFHATLHLFDPAGAGDHRRRRPARRADRLLDPAPPAAAAAGRRVHHPAAAGHPRHRARLRLPADLQQLVRAAADQQPRPPPTSC